MQKHILLADSDLESLESVTRTLQQHDYRVSVARNGAEAYAMACALRPDCVIFDVDMDAPSGTIMYARLRRNPETRRMAAIVHSHVTPRYGTGIATLRKNCAAAHLAQSVREALTPRVS